MNPEIPSRRSLWFIFITILIIIITLPISITAQQSSNRNVTPGSSFVADANADSPTLTWTTSPSGEFAFGFKQVAHAGGFLLSIWLDQVPEKTVVWSANRDNPVPSGSRVQLNAAGTLELIHQTTGRSIWAANDLQGRSGRVAYAAVLDTGNLVLANNTSGILWQSFDSPTDTLLPGQELERGRVLVSSFSETNHSKGRFKLTFQADGDLVLHTRMFPLDDNNVAYWRSETNDIGFRLIFNQSGSIYITRSNGTLVKPLFNNGASVGGQFHQQRLTLDYDGVLRHYVDPKSVHAFVPSNICLEIGEKNTGGGACGYNSICSLGSYGRPICDCPPGYSSRDGLMGCAPDFAQHRCDQQSQDAQNFRFEVMFNRDWPFVDYANFMNVDEEWCKQSCLNDCYCAVAIYENRYCYEKSLPFSNGRVVPDFDGKSFFKIRENSTKSNLNPNTSATTNSSRRSLIITLSVLLGCSVLFILLSSFFFLFYFYPRKLKLIRPSKVDSVGVNTIMRFSFKELQEATIGFRDELGRGACSTVYKGAVEDSGKVVAVKKLNRIAKESDQEFQAEVRSISRTNHKNLVQLLGYCYEGQHRILVYEFMTNGSLASFLFQNSPRPNWYIRVQIAFAIVRGLCYLHEECSSPIIHCDIKPQNVLLDESYTPKIADFGLAKLLKPDQTRTITGIRGTRGYVAPEWFRNMPITVKVDVYSFGILLLELLCCRKNYEVDVEDEREVVLADWVYDCYQVGALDVLVAGDEEAKSDIKMFERFVWIALWCVQEDPTVRPQMKRVMHMLEGSIQVPAPPDPTAFIT